MREKPLGLDQARAKRALLIAVTLVTVFFGVALGSGADAQDCGAYLEAPTSVIETVLVPGQLEAGVSTPTLEDGEAYVLVVQGSFTYNHAGGTADARALVVDGTRPFDLAGLNGMYCVEVRGGGSALLMNVKDTYYKDNGGALTVLVVELD